MNVIDAALVSGSCGFGAVTLEGVATAEGHLI